MPTHVARSRDDIARLADAAFRDRVRPQLTAADEGKFVAVDVDTGDFEVDADDYAAITRLQGRRPGADIWLEMAGEPTAYKMMGLQ